MKRIRRMTIVAVLAALVLPIGSIGFSQDVEAQPKTEATHNGLRSVTGLRCEDLINPLGVDAARPKLSWRMGSPAHGAAQTAYQILAASDPKRLTEEAADLWNTGKVVSNQSRLILYGGKQLPRGRYHYWRVRIWDEKGTPSQWSEPAKWTSFDLHQDKDWKAQWIQVSEKLPEDSDRSSPWLRKTFQLKELPDRAMIYVNSVGYFQLFINGKRVGKDEFTPHVGQYNKRTLCITYDVTSYLQKGANSIGLWLGAGWSKWRHGLNLKSPAVRAQLEIGSAHEPKTIVCTDTSWRGHPSYLAYLGDWKGRNFGGEIYDAGRDHIPWADTLFDDSSWLPVSPAPIADTPVSSELLQRNRIVETITAVKVSKRTDHKGVTEWIVDMGKAMTGTVEIDLPAGEKGRVVEMNFRDSGNPWSYHGQRSEYIYRGNGREVFRNRFNYASFRFIALFDLPDDANLKPEHVKGHFITTDLPLSSSFDSSNKTFNQVYDMMVRTLRCLMLGGYQVDCHSRERLGYGGDGHSSLDSTLYLMRSDAFYRKWLRDWVDGQKEDGGLYYTAPSSNGGGGPFWCGMVISATLKNYQHYGDLDLVKSNYPTIKKFLELAQSKTKDGLQEKFVGGWYLGDWASPAPEINATDRVNLFVNCYMAYALEQSAQLAELLGKKKDAATFRNWADERRTATHKAYYDPKAKIYGKYGDQVDCILPLISGTVPKKLEETIFNRFEHELTVERKGHLFTGLSGTYLMIQYLQSVGRDDLISLFASKRTCPSWGYMIERGSTATWEHWGKGGSKIHNCYNSIGSWFIHSLGGIKPDPEHPGFQRFIIAPAIVKEATWVKTSYASPYGTIVSNWKLAGDRLTMDIVVPPNSTATVVVPSRAPSTVTINNKPAGQSPHVRLLKTENDRSIFSVAAGRYTFMADSPL